MQESPLGSHTCTHTSYWTICSSLNQATHWWACSYPVTSYITHCFNGTLSAGERRMRVKEEDFGVDMRWGSGGRDWLIISGWQHWLYWEWASTIKLNAVLLLPLYFDLTIEDCVEGILSFSHLEKTYIYQSLHVCVLVVASVSISFFSCAVSWFIPLSYVQFSLIC